MHRSARFSLSIAAGAAFALTACSDSSTAVVLPGTFEITIQNLTAGQPFTPPLVATHSDDADLYDVGASASAGIQAIAENGDLGPLMAALEADPDVAAVVVAVAGDPPPVLPGQSVTFMITSDANASLLSFAAMLICTNDGFVGLDAMTLPTTMGQQITRDLVAYDAGTEMNTEDFADIVPPCPALTGVMSTVPGTGMSNPALAETDVIRMHPGVSGSANLQPGLHGWTDPVARITITRTN